MRLKRQLPPTLKPGNLPSLARLYAVFNLALGRWRSLEWSNYHRPRLISVFEQIDSMRKWSRKQLIATDLNRLFCWFYDL
tara:strand:- start:311 stop:550 length:240 start_codon:yes stop_codon:yes gene_type:complete